MKKTHMAAAIGTVMVLALLGVQMLPPAPVTIPAQLPREQRDAQRLLGFEGIHNFRDLGGYASEDGRDVKWGILYRSGTLHDASDSDLDYLDQLQLHTLVDFRSSAEKAAEPDRLPQPLDFTVVEIPTLDGGDNSVATEIMARIETGDFTDFEPQSFMLEANRHFADRFTPQYRQFLQTVLEADGEPILWHCSAGKDRAGYAAAILLRILGVPQEVVVQDYMLSKEYALAARRRQLLLLRIFKGAETADKLEVIMGVEPEWLEAGFAQIDARYGSFDNYVREALELDRAAVARLRSQLLE
ncbi:MAG: tyrosine-protein phosphatase [Halieaceae bacterium]